jgi:hypothetical protein
MKKIVVFLLLAIALNGCSILNKIMVINLSNGPILVEYEIDQLTEGIFKKEAQPHFYAIKKDGGDFERTNQNPKTVLSKNANDRISFILQPNEIAEICGFFGRIIDDPTKVNYARFNLKEIKITTADSTILYAQGDHSRHLFSPVDKYGRGITFR